MKTEDLVALMSRRGRGEQIDSGNQGKWSIVNYAAIPSAVAVCYDCSAPDITKSVGEHPIKRTVKSIIDYLVPYLSVFDAKVDTVDPLSVDLPCQDCINGSFVVRFNPGKGTPLFDVWSSGYITEKVAVPGEAESGDETRVAQRAAESFPAADSRPSFYAIEKSNEFWRMAEETCFLVGKHIVKQGRHFIIYDHCEGPLSDSRAQSEIQRLMNEYARTKLGGDVDVIMHPYHHNAVVMANMFASALRTPARIVPLVQEDNYESLYPIDRVALEAWVKRWSIEKDRNRSPSVLLIDDAAISARTLLEMYGFCERLGFKVKGALVLLNRLTRNIESAVKATFPNFFWLYRLHVAPKVKETCPVCARKASISPTEIQLTVPETFQYCNHVLKGELAAHEVITG
jgi:adenine/guanine phosphoribosyltransferase-like PRPP-binding protein